MHDFFSREPDPVEGLLRPPPPTDNEALHQAVYTRTRRLLRRRRLVRQFAYAASLLVSFTVGAGTMRMTMPSRSTSKELPPPIAEKETPTPQEAPYASDERTEKSVLAAEWHAFDSTNQRGALYRQAADRYMTEETDLQSALRCYSNALDNGTEKDLAISTEDNWLLMAIKNARQKEKSDANQGG